MSDSVGQIKTAGENYQPVKTGDTKQKPWGKEEIEYASGELMVKKLTMNPGQQCSVQIHRIKREVVVVLSGELHYFTVKPEISGVPEQDRSLEAVQGLVKQHLILKPQDMAVVEPGTIHYMAAEKQQAVYREISFGPNETTRIFDPNAHLRQGEDLSK